MLTPIIPAGGGAHEIFTSNNDTVFDELIIDPIDNCVGSVAEEAL